jgi:hypothetical protein
VEQLARQFRSRTTQKDRRLERGVAHTGTEEAVKVDVRAALQIQAVVVVRIAQIK